MLCTSLIITGVIILLPETNGVQKMGWKNIKMYTFFNILYLISTFLSNLAVNLSP